MPPAVTLRPAVDSDARYLLELEEACMRGYAEALWGSWRPSSTVETLDPTGHEIIELNGEPVGCIAVAWHADHVCVRKLYIGPDFQRRGIGAIVLGRKTELAANKGLPTRLSVLTTNPADSFYKREGFILEAETPERRTFMKIARSASDATSAKPM